MNAINWMMSKAQISTLEDGTVEYFFAGTLPSAMCREIKASAASFRGTNGESTYSGSSDLFSWSAVFGARNSTKNTVRFHYADYTIPAGKA